jgi:hypothetical protein
VAEGIAEPLPDYVDDVLMAQYIGVTLREYHAMPYYEIDQYRVVRAAQLKAQNAVNERQQGRKR